MLNFKNILNVIIEKKAGIKKQFIYVHKNFAIFIIN